MNNLLIVHPHDPSTFFLKPIWEFISQSHNDVKVIYIACDDNEHKNALHELSQSNFKNILFLGHGSSTALMGAKDGDYQHVEFINKNGLDIFSDKNVLSLSCRSSDFFRYEDRFNYIGFDDIPSEISEVMGAREFESNLYQNVDEEVIEQFRSLIVDITCNSVNDWLTNEYTIKMVYHRIRIRTSQAITKVLLGKDEVIFKKALVGLLNDFKNNMNHYCNT